MYSMWSYEAEFEEIRVPGEVSRSYGRVRDLIVETLRRHHNK
jgi:hypothetical protein